MTWPLQSFLSLTTIRRLCAFAVMMVGLFASQMTMAQTVTYSESFTNALGYSAGTTQWDNWTTFRAGAPTSDIQSITISGSLDATGRTCSDPALSQQIMDNFRTSGGTLASVSCGGFFWNSGTCGTGIELNVGSAAEACTASSTYALRPQIGSGNSNWGGINGVTVNAPSQTMSVSYTVGDPLVVTTTADSGAGSLRDVITYANANASEDDISFNISGSGVHIISPLSELPQITDDGVSIDGSTQTGASCGQLTTGTQHSLMIHLDGVSAGLGSKGLKTNSDSVTFKGLSITNFDSFGVFANSGADNFTLECAYIGVAPDGVTKGSNAKASNQTPAIKINSSTNPTIRNSLISGQDDDTNDDGLRLQGVTGGTIEGNIIGLNAAGTAALGNADDGILLDSGTSGTVIGGTTAATRNLTSGNGSGGIRVALATDIQILGNYIGLGRDGTTTFGNGNDGIVVLSTSTAAIYGNRIAGNGGQGIDLDNNGVTANDAGDPDIGPNDRLNFPKINAVTVNGTTIGYDVDLDVTANTNGYRVDFFRNTNLVTDNGQGDTYLGFIDTGNHAGGSINYTGTFTANETVSVGQIISTTATRKTASSYDITSEFSENHAAVSSADPLIIINTNDSGTGSLREAITYANANTGEDAITFEIPGVGPHVITLATALPYISDDGVTIDAASQGGASCGNLWAGTPPVLKVQLDGTNSGGYGLVASANNILFKGLSVVNFGSGLVSLPSATGTQFTCNYAGLDFDGTNQGNTTAGIIPHGTNTIVGGANVGDGNVISANGSVGLSVGQDVINFSIRGNFIGTDPTGLLPRPNGNIGVSQFTGGTATWGDVTQNLISGNVAQGILLSSTTSVSGASGDVIIAGNYIGVDRTGNVALPNGGDGIEFPSGSISGVTIGGTTTTDRNVISGNGGNGVEVVGVSDIDILGNYIGLGSDGSTPLTNVAIGVALNSTSGVKIGDGTAGGLNIIGSGNVGAQVNGTNSTISINGNYFNTDSTGNNSVLSGYDGIVINGNVTTLDVLDNVIGQVSQDKIEFWGSYTATGVTVQGNKLGVGADGVTDIGGGVGLVGFRIWAGYAVSGLTLGGSAAGEGNVIRNNGLSGVYVDSGITGVIVGNTILDNVGDGVEIISTTAALAIYANGIYDNGGLGIDLGTSGVTANDGGDADTGANDFLNFPVINTISASGTTVSYDFDLDVPADTNGYRIEFFRNSNLVTENGEGEVFLGFIDTGNHAGGSVNYAGSFTASTAVSVGNIISTTTTRKTASSYDITSEFSLNSAITSALVVTNADDSGAGSLRNAITFANANTGEDAITFAIPGAGPHVITLAAILPSISDAGISIDGTTQSGATCGDLWGGTPHTLKIQLDANGNSLDVLVVSGDSVLIKGLSLTGASGVNSGVYVAPGSDSAQIACSYLGLAPDGTADGNVYGIASSSSNTVIGGALVGDGNVIGSNSNDGIVTFSGATAQTIRGNFIGADPTGLLQRANGRHGISNDLTSGVVSWAEVRNNLISGNTNHGIGLTNVQPVSGSSGDVVIAGNYIGVDRTGNTTLANGGDGINFGTGSISGVTIGGTTAADRNLISGNTGDGLQLTGISDVNILGNYIGIGGDGVTERGNSDSGILIEDTSNTDVGDGTAAGRNIISGNNLQGISYQNVTTLSIDGNYIGLAADGDTTRANANGIDSLSGSTNSDVSIIGNVVSGNTLRGILFRSPGNDNAGLVITSNYIGTDATGLLNRGNTRDGLRYNFASSTLSGVVIGEPGAGNVISGNGDHGIAHVQGSGLSIQSNLIGWGVDGVTAIGNDMNGVEHRYGSVTIGGSGAGEGNRIANNGLDGYTTVFASSTAAMVANEFHDNAGLGIDLSDDGVTANDSSDGDSGANDLLNFPVINDFSGTATTLYYDFDLDVPSNANGYRVEFFKNDVQDSTLHGEGQTFLGFVDVAHSGGNSTFTGSFTGSEAIDEGDFISATTTRKTGVSSYDITSEFSLNYTSDAATELTAAKSVDVFDPTSAGLYALPGNDVVSSMTVTNIGNSAADTDSIVIIDAVPSEMTFYNGDMDDGGPATGAVYFTQTGGANLTFNPASDAAYSNSGSRPANMAGCTYTPSAGYDSNVTYVCFNPKGAMASGNPDPTFTMQFRARIK